MLNFGRLLISRDSQFFSPQYCLFDSQSSNVYCLFFLISAYISAHPSENNSFWISYPHTGYEVLTLGHGYGTSVVEMASACCKPTCRASVVLIVSKYFYWFFGQKSMTKCCLNGIPSTTIFKTKIIIHFQLFLSIRRSCIGSCPSHSLDCFFLRRSHWLGFWYLVTKPPNNVHDHLCRVYFSFVQILSILSFISYTYCYA